MFKTFLNRLPQMFVAAYTGHRWVWHVAAAFITWILVVIGFDWWFFTHTRSESLYWLIMFSGIGGFFIPVLTPVVLYIIGEWQSNKHLVYTAVAVAQASIVAWVIVALYKTFTGRVEPDFLFNSGIDRSSVFNFGFFEYGIFWGWPSHHTAVAIAGATALYLLWKHPVARTVALVWSITVAVGAAVGYHWFSDVLAGVIVGLIVGIAVATDKKN